MENRRCFDLFEKDTSSPSLPTLLYETLPSTNRTALSLSEEEHPLPMLVLAREQSQGKGRLGRSFFSPKGQGLYFTLLFSPTVSPENLLFFTPFAALAVCEALESLIPALKQTQALSVKWINDIYCRGKKLCGILCESRITAGKQPRVVLAAGIGVNLGSAAYPEELRLIATSLENEGFLASEEVEKLFLPLARAIAKRLLTFEEAIKDPEAVKKAYEKRLFLLEKPLDVYSAGGEFLFRGVAKGLREDFALFVEKEDGVLVPLQAGEVSLHSMAAAMAKGGKL